MLLIALLGVGVMLCNRGKAVTNTLIKRSRPGLAGLALLALSACGNMGERTADEPFEVTEATIGGIQQAILSGQTSCRAVVEAYLARIEAYDKSTGLNAITVLNPGALARADELDTALAAGEELGSLFCAPMLIKDNYDTFDMVTTGGSIALRYSIPPDDAFMVARLREADAILIAKTNMAEWAFSPRQTISSSFGTTANAYDQTRVPAGSSGGTASGVAASFGVAGMGSDTGNSIRGPASHLALFGIRSTIGLTSRDGIIPLAFDRDIAGPMTRTVEDAARIFNVVAGYDPADSLTEGGRGKREEDYTKFLKADGLQGIRLGVLRALVNTEDADAEITTLFERSLTELTAAGAVIIDDFEIPDLDAHLGGNYFCPRFRYDMWVYLRSLGDNAPIHDVMEVMEDGRYSDHAESGLEYFADYPLDLSPDEWDEPCPTFPNHEGRNGFLADVVAAMDAAGIDAIIYPGWTNPPAPLDNAVEDYKGDNSQLIAPATGMPAVTIPMGFWQDRLPAGLQILGRPWSEGLLFQLAYAYEQATHHRRPPADYPSLALEEPTKD